MPAGARSILIAGYFGFGNAGDEAILASMLADLRRLRPDLDAVVASGSPAATAAEHGVRTVRAIARDHLPAVIAAMRASDLVLLGGGGLFEDYWEVPLERIFTPRSGGLPFYAGFALLAAWLGRPAMIYAAGVGPLTSEAGRTLTRVVFDLCAAATVRDAGSLALLESLGAQAPRAEVAADPAFGFAVPDPASLAPLLAALGLAPGERPVGVALRPWSFGPDPEVWEAEAAAGLGRFLAESEERLLLLPFQAGDVVLLRRLRAALGASVRDRVLLAERRLTPAELAGVTAACGRVLAMRYHAALFALAAGVPVAALAYDPKVASLLAAAGLADVSLEPQDRRGEEIVRVLRQARAPAAGFPEAMRRRAARSAELAIELLKRERPAAAEAARFLDDLAVEKVAAAFRLEIERSGLSERLSSSSSQDAAQAARDLAAANARIPRLEQESAALREQRELILAERNDLDRRLTALERTLTYRLVSRFWRLLRQVFPEGSRRRKLYRLGRRAAGKLLGARDPAGPAAWTAGAGGAGTGTPEGSPDFRAELLRFEERVRAGGASQIPQVVAIFSGTQLVESEGQRPTQLALALARRGIPVVFVYWRWWDREWRPQDRLEEGIVQIPIDVVTRRPEMLTGAFAFPEVMERIALFEFPHPAFFATLSAANSAGWITVYDMLDDWEEFHRVGQAIWWDEDFERHLASACDAVFGINEVLAGRLRDLGGGAAAEVVGNGLKPGLGTIGAPRPLARGEVTVGYFGYLAGAWFDWELILEAARRRPAWRFYLIGYGGAPEGSALPPNVELLGKQPQADLAAYAANWDVAVVPFKPDRLAAGADPIKTYEYLAMGLPVVVTGVHPPPGGEAFVRRAAPEDGVEGFLRAIEATGGRGGAEQEAARGAFAASCSWDHRLESLLGSLAEGRQRVAEKRALFASAPEEAS